MTPWLDALTGEARVAGVLVTIVAIEGSAPREAGAKMLVTEGGLHGTIGGGSLELAAVRIARTMLAASTDQSARPDLRRIAIEAEHDRLESDGTATVLFEAVAAHGAERGWIEVLRAALERREAAVLVTPMAAGESTAVVTAGSPDTVTESLDENVLAAARSLLAAAGGSTAAPPPPVLLRGPKRPHPGSEAGAIALLEAILPTDFDVLLFGAGHVGKALVGVLAGLPCRITWIDDRPDQFPPQLPANVRAVTGGALENHVAEAPPGGYFLVMTHSHKHDLLLCRRILARRDFRYLGLIGSRRKRQRFEESLRRDGLGDQDLERLTCPIGIEGISGKHPAEIAIAVAAELLLVRSANAGVRG